MSICTTPWLSSQARVVIDCPHVNSCVQTIVCCSSCPVCMEVLYCCSAMPSVHESLGGNLAPLPTDKSNWHIHQNVIVCTPWHIHQTCRLGIKLCYTVCFSLSLQSALMSCWQCLCSTHHKQINAKVTHASVIANRQTGEAVTLELNVAEISSLVQDLCAMV